MSLTALAGWREAQISRDGRGHRGAAHAQLELRALGGERKQSEQESEKAALKERVREQAPHLERAKNQCGDVAEHISNAGQECEECSPHNADEQGSRDDGRSCRPVLEPARELRSRSQATQLVAMPPQRPRMRL